MPRPDPAPGYYEGRDADRDNIYEVRVSGSGKWYAMRLYRRGGRVCFKYVGHHVRLGHRIEL